MRIAEMGMPGIVPQIRKISNEASFFYPPELEFDHE